jgi:hypothetical protein
VWSRATLAVRRGHEGQSENAWIGSEVSKRGCWSAQWRHEGGLIRQTATEGELDDSIGKMAPDHLHVFVSYRAH